MEFTIEKKEELEQKIVEIINASVEQKKIPQEELSSISTYVLNNVDSIQNREGLISFLEQLSARWSIFDDLYALENGGQQEKQEAQAVSNVEQLIESGNIDQALEVAKQATGE